jgi:hypothetical protein
MFRRLFKVSLRLGVLVALVAILLKLLDDREQASPIVAAPASKPKPEPVVDWVEPQGTVCPTSHPIKAKLGSKVFRKPDMASYDSSKPDRCYASEDAAQRDGFREAKR